MQKLQFICAHFNELDIRLLYDILKLRQEVFIVEQECYYLDNDGKDLDSYHLIATDSEGHIVAYARLLPKGISYPHHASFGRVVTSPLHRGKLLGKQLMQEVMKHCRRLFPSDPIKISAQSYLLKFYAGFGFESIGEEYIEDNIPHQAMIFPGETTNV